MTKLRFLLLISIVLQLPFHSLGQFSRQQAEDLVLNTILASDTGYINLYSSYDAIPDSSTIILSNGLTITPPFPYNWVFFSDDKPFANWNHPCRYIFINSNTGDFELFSNSSYPRDLQISYQGLLVVYPCPATCNTTGSPFASGMNHILPTTTNPHLYAVLINGKDDLVQPYGSCTCNRDYDIAVIYNALEEIGYITPQNPQNQNDNHIITLYDNGSTTYPYAGKTDFHNDWDGYQCPNPPCSWNEVNGSADWNTINTTFTDFADPSKPNYLKPEDQLFVYITGLGDKIGNEPNFQCYPSVGQKSYYTVNDLKAAIQNINCAQMIFVMQQNYSGGFISPLINDPLAVCKNRIVITATGDGSFTPGLSYREIWAHCGNIDEFTFYFAAALRGHYEGRWPWQWSYSVGSFPFSNSYFNWTSSSQSCFSRVHPSDYIPDSGTPPYTTIEHGNNDGYTQLIEAFNYANCMDTWSQKGYYNQRKSIPNISPLGVNCTTDYETPTMGVNNGFGSDTLYCLNGIAGNTSTGIGTQQVLSRSYLLGGNLNVHSNINIQTSAELTMGVDNSIIDVDANYLFTAEQKIKLSGVRNSPHPNGLVIENFNNTLNLENATLSSVCLSLYGSHLNIGLNNHPSTFNNCPSLVSNRGTAVITNSNFNNSPLYVVNGDHSLTNSATVTGCQFTATPQIDNFALENYNNYSIKNNVFSGGLYGIALYYCSSLTGNHVVQNNQISNCTEGGLYIYGSDASVNMNHIYNNLSGIEILDNSSNVSLAGNPNAQNYSQTQEINDCTGFEIYATNNCFPYYMQYNAIIDEHRIPPDPAALFYYDNLRTPGLPFPKYYVSQNCWGQNFVPSNDLKLNYGLFFPYPTWCPSDNIIPIGQDEAMYNTAMDDVDSSNYTEAMNLFKLLIETYPKSEYAKASMKAMFETESYTGNDFSDLKVFYLTNDSILADTSLTQLGDFLANNCDVQMHNYASAISWYENRIQNSADPNDSVFAIIDLGHLYTIMDTTGNKSIFIGSMPQYKPKSKAKYEAYRDSLIFLLPFTKDPLKKSLTKLQNGQLLQNVPNPSSSSTDFYFRLYCATSADIKIYDISGILKQVIPITNLNDGTQKITFNTSNLSSGIYEYALTINGMRTDTKKLVVIK